MSITSTFRSPPCRRHVSKNLRKNSPAKARHQPSISRQSLRSVRLAQHGKQETKSNKFEVRPKRTNERSSSSRNSSTAGSKAKRANDMRFLVADVGMRFDFIVCRDLLEFAFILANCIMYLRQESRHERAM